MNGAEVVASTGEPAFAVNRAGEINAWNESAASFFGYRRQEALGRYCWELFAGEDLFQNPYCGESCPLRTCALQGGPVNASKMYFRDSLGKRRLVRLSVLVVRTRNIEDSEIVHLVQPLPEEPGVHTVTAASDRARTSVNSGARLTDRQIEVLRLLGDGEGTREIAEFLHISSSTVRHHVQAILRNLKVHNRLEAVSLARRIGLL